jgi:DNA-binding transcriptional MocR family regulator
VTSRLQLQTEGRLELAIGQPDLRLLPFDELRASTVHRFGIREPEIMHYCPYRGTAQMRGKLSAFLSLNYGIPIDPERLFITNGASHAIDLILSRFVREGDTVMVEEPTYFLGLQILRDRYPRIVPVPTDEQGMDVDALERLLESERPKLVYTIPIHHNPTGATLSLARRRKLVALAKKHDFLIVADEVYQLLTYEGSPPPPMQVLDPERVLSLGSFSKILAPGLRLGWIDAAPPVIAELVRCGVHQSGGGSAPFVAALVESALETGIQQEYLVRIRDVYRRRCHTMIAALERSLDPAITFARPEGGFFVWMHLPGRNTEDLLAKAHAEGVGFLPGKRASVVGGLSDRLRLCFTFYDEREIESAIRLLAKVLN